MKAVVFVDVQKDFIDGALRNEKAIEVTPEIVEFAKECVEKGYRLYATRDTHEESLGIRKKHVDLHKKNGTIEGVTIIDADSGYLATLEGKKLPVEHCIEGTDGWQVDPRLMDVIIGKATFVNKPTFGSYDLADIMLEDFKDELPEEIVMVGFCTDICVASNALLLRARFPNVRIAVMKDLCAGVTETKHEAALETMRSCQIDVI